MDIAERHRLSIRSLVLPVQHEMHRGLASMYEADDRFRQTINRPTSSLCRCSRSYVTFLSPSYHRPVIEPPGAFGDDSG